MPSLSTPHAGTSVWSGPNGDGPNGGITFSTLSRYLVCKERFRLHMMEGLRPVDSFNHRIEYGSMFHVCQEHYTSGKTKGRKTASSPIWSDKLLEYAQSLCKLYPLQQEQINHWASVCQVQFPHYITYWERHPDSAITKPLLREQTFDVRYTLPSKRQVRLRGKWDGIDLIDDGIYLLETKTKGDINEPQLKKQLLFDLQTMLYLIAFNEYKDDDRQPGNSQGYYISKDIKGFRYNVIRRPLSGGKYSISQRKDETRDEFFERLYDIIRDDPEWFFMRWRVEVSPSDIERFKRESLDPILEGLLDWWDDQVRLRRDGDSPFANNIKNLHFRLPYGVYNPLLEGYSTDLDGYLDNGSTLGLTKTTDLFPELKE